MTLTQSLLAAFAFSMLTACANGSADYPSRDEGPTSQSQKRGNMEGKRPGMPDLSEAAATLGVSEQALEEALKNAGGPPPDLDKAAATLGVSADTLKAALPPPPRRR